MDLNAEQIKKVLEHCANWTFETGCKGCPYDGKCIDEDVIKDALTLINSQEQRIKELTEENESLKQAMEHEHASFMETFGEYGEKCERLTDEVASWKAIAEGYQKQFEDCAEDRARLTEENERVKLEYAGFEAGAKHAVSFVKADTVRKMHSMLCEGRVSNDNVVIVANQVAKEMLEGK